MALYVVRGNWIIGNTTDGEGMPLKVADHRNVQEHILTHPMLERRELCEVWVVTNYEWRLGK